LLICVSRTCDNICKLDPSTMGTAIHTSLGNVICTENVSGQMDNMHTSSVRCNA